MSNPFTGEKKKNDCFNPESVSSGRIGTNLKSKRKMRNRFKIVIFTMRRGTAIPLGLHVRPENT